MLLPQEYYAKFPAEKEESEPATEAKAALKCSWCNFETFHSKAMVLHEKLHMKGADVDEAAGNR